MYKKYSYDIQKWFPKSGEESAVAFIVDVNDYTNFVLKITSFNQHQMVFDALSHGKDLPVGVVRPTTIEHVYALLPSTTRTEYSVRWSIGSMSIGPWEFLHTTAHE